MPNFFIIDLKGTEISPEERELLAHPNVGGVILFTKNFTDLDQLHALIHNIRTINPNMMIAVDHEGGYVQRFQRHGFRSIPAPRVFGETFDMNPKTGIKLAKRFGQIMAEDLQQHGIDFSFAPVLDLHGDSVVIGGLDRAFHSDPNVVSLLAGVFIRGMKRAGMVSVGKHFPGHGAIVADSHVAKPVSKSSMEHLWANELLPYKLLIKHGLLDAIMPAHVTYEAIDALPAGFSSKWLKTILREQLGFEGVIVSDCLSMTGADIGDLQTRSLQALEAGCDLLIVCHQEPAVLKQLLENIHYESEESQKRIQTFRNKMIKRPLPLLKIKSEKDISEEDSVHTVNSIFNRTSTV